MKVCPCALINLNKVIFFSLLICQIVLVTLWIILLNAMEWNGVYVSVLLCINFGCLNMVYNIFVVAQLMVIFLLQ